MGQITKAIHKSMVQLYNGESILRRQLNILSSLGIAEYIITVGPFEEQLRETAVDFPNCKFIFVRNDIYHKTNYIYSMFLARDYIDDDMLLLHGDLVFNKNFANDILKNTESSCAPVNCTCRLPEKDFKARIVNDRVYEISIGIFEADCYAFQPFYKLSKAAASAWVGKVTQYVVDGHTKCYAENALNEILPALEIKPFAYDEHFVEEIDTVEDFQRVSSAIAEFDRREGYLPSL